MIVENKASSIELINEKDKEKLKEMIIKYDFLVADEKGQTILHHLCREGNKDLIFDIINTLQNENRDDEVAKIICVRDYKDWVPLYYAIDSSESGFPDIVEFLLKNGLNPNSVDSKGISPLHLACYKGQDDNVEILLKHKSDPNLRDVAGRIPLTYAIMESQTNAVQALLDHNQTDINSIDVHGDSLMHYSVTCKGNALLYVIMLGERGINVNIQNNEGDTPLILCAKGGARDNIKIIQKLLEFKADSNIKNKIGQSFYTILSEEAEKENFDCDSQGSEDEIKIQENTINREDLKLSNNNPTNNLNLSTIIWYILIPLIVLIISTQLS